MKLERIDHFTIRTRPRPRVPSMKRRLSIGWHKLPASRLLALQRHRFDDPPGAMLVRSNSAWPTAAAA
jgi:hypothetical protein